MKHKTKITIASIAGLVAVGGIAFAAQGYQEHKSMKRMFAPDKIMEKVDANGDNAASQEEIMTLAKTYFDEADADGNAFLTKAEIVSAIDNSALPKRMKKRSGRIADRMVSQGDVDLDGQLAITEIENRVGKFHALADWNDDGNVEMAEAKRLRHSFGGRGHRNKNR